MHGCRAFLVNAEVDSMGGVVEGGVGINFKASPQQVAIEKAQAKLRQEFDVREERRRELEFLEKGGDPLDFKLRNVPSTSVQSTSLTDQHPEQFVNSEAKGSFALTASPHGDSVESSGRPGVLPVCEPNSADNLMLFHGENEIVEGEKNLLRFRTSIVASEQSSPLPTSQNAKELGEFASFGLPKKAYKRRNRSRPNRDGVRSSSTDVQPFHGGSDSYSTGCHGIRDTKPGVSVIDNQKDQKLSSNYNLKPTGSSDSLPPKNVSSNSQSYKDSGGAWGFESTSLSKGNLKSFALDANVLKNAQDNQRSQCAELDDLGAPVEMTSERPEVAGREPADSHDLESTACITKEVDNKAACGRMNGFTGGRGDKKCVQNDGQIIHALSTTKGLDSESSCTHTSISLDGNNDSEMCTNLRNNDFNGNAKGQTLACEGTQSMMCDALAEEVNGTKTDNNCDLFASNSRDEFRTLSEEASTLKAHEGSRNNWTSLKNEERVSVANGAMDLDGHTVVGTNSKSTNLSNHCFSQIDPTCSSRLQDSVDPSIQEKRETTLSVGVSSAALQQQVCSEVHLKLVSKKDEDYILEEAQIIEAKRKRIAELSVSFSSVENCQKSHWDFVLEEMAWLANDFSQERLWKITAASHISHQVALTCRVRFEKQNSFRKQREVGRRLSDAIMEFWHSVEGNFKETDLQISGKNGPLGVWGYAIRFLKQSKSHAPLGQVQPPLTPDRISDFGISNMSSDDNLTEENLFYIVSCGSMETYRKSIESHLMQCEKTGSSMQEEVETSAYDGATEFGSQDYTFEEDEGQTGTYYLPGAFEGSRSSKFAQKKHKHINRAYGPRLYDTGGDLPFVHCMENKVGTQQSVLIGKRSSNNLSVSIPTKRVRTAARQRVPCSSAGTSGCFQMPSKTDASSGDTNSFQDDQSTLHGGSQILNGLEVESAGEFEKHLPFNSAEVSKPKKKKKEKHMVSNYGQRWQLDSNFQNDQRDFPKKKMENHQLEYSGNNGIFGQHVMKKPKLMRPSLDNSFENVTPMSGSISSPVASQMSNMPNPNKLIRILGNGSRGGRKSKFPKIPAAQMGFGSPWSMFEDQALVVLVHDMGPNWELVSDAINNTLQFKCIFRNPKECKERHKILMDRTASDGADSAEDSGSSQPYPSTLPGIPKGSARQLFQRLQEPIEEDTLKSHFEKIIMLWQKHHCQKKIQDDGKDLKQIQQPHSSHTLALSQVSPNNLNGGPALTPLDLCEATASSPDVLSMGYQHSHANGVAVNQGTMASLLPCSSANSLVQGSSNMIIGGNFSMPAAPLNASARDGRHMYPRAASLSIEEQRMQQQYNQMLSGRSSQQSSLAASGAFPGSDRGVRMLPGSSGMGIVGGLARSMPMARPGFQGIASSPMLNSGSMLSSGMVTLPSPVNMHPGVGSTQGNSMMRSRDHLQVTRPGQIPESQRQMMVSELPIQGSHGNNQQVPPYGGLTSSLSSQPATPPVPSYPIHHQQPRPMSPHQSHLLGNPHLQGPNHVTSPQQQAYARAAKERQFQQRFLQQQQQQQQQFSTSNALMPHVQPQSQLPLTSSMQPNSQIQSQTSSPVSLTPLTPSSSTNPMFQHQQKHQIPPHGLGRNAHGSGLNSQMGKQQRQHQLQQQQFQQAGRQHPQRQQPQSQQPAKVLKGVVRGNVMIHQNLPVDSSLLNGLSASTGRQSPEKSEQVMHLMQGQGVNSVQQSSSLGPSPSNQAAPSNQGVPPQKTYSGQGLQSNQSISTVSSGPQLPNSHQVASPQLMASSNHSQMQAQSHQTSAGPGQPNVRRIVQQNRVGNSDVPSKLHVEDVQVEKHSANNASQVTSTKALSRTGTDISKAMSIFPNSSMHLGSAGTTPLKSSSGKDAASHVSQGHERIPPSGSSNPIGHEITMLQQQQQPSQVPQPSLLQTKQQHQLPMQQQSEPQTPIFQAGNSELYVRPTNSRLE